MDIIGILIFFIVISIVSNFIEKIKSNNKESNEKEDSPNKFEIPSIKEKKPPIRVKEKQYSTIDDLNEKKYFQDLIIEDTEENKKINYNNKTISKNNNVKLVNGLIFAQILQPPKAYQNIKNNKK